MKITKAQEHSFITNILLAKEDTEKYGLNSWRSLDTMQAFIKSLYILEIINLSEFVELCTITRDWAVKWHN